MNTSLGSYWEPSFSFVCKIFVCLNILAWGSCHGSVTLLINAPLCVHNSWPCFHNKLNTILYICMCTLCFWANITWSHDIIVGHVWGQSAGSVAPYNPVANQLTSPMVDHHHQHYGEYVEIAESAVFQYYAESAISLFSSISSIIVVYAESAVSPVCVCVCRLWCVLPAAPTPHTYCPSSLHILTEVLPTSAKTTQWALSSYKIIVLMCEWSNWIVYKKFVLNFKCFLSDRNVCGILFYCVF